MNTCDGGHFEGSEVLITNAISKASNFIPIYKLEQQNVTRLLNMEKNKFNSIKLLICALYPIEGSER